MTVNFYLILALSFFVSTLANPDCDNINEACEDIETAKACGKINLCIDNVWIYKQPTGKRDSVCDVCLRMVKEARDTLQSNETQEELKEVLDGSCDLLRISPLKLECKKIMNNFIPELVAILSSEMDPETVCTVSKLCNNGMAWYLDYNTDLCTYCMRFAQMAMNNITDMTPESFRQELLYTCRSKGSYSDACSFYVTAYSDFLYGQIFRALGRKPCEAVRICPTNSPVLVDRNLPLNLFNKCTICKSGLKVVKRHMLRVKNGKDFKNQILRIYKELGLSETGYETLVNFPAERLHNMFKKKFDTEEFCDEVYCTETGADVPVWPLLPATEKLNKPEEHSIDFMSLLENVENFIPDEKKENEEQEEREIEKEKEMNRVVLSAGDPIETPVVIGPITSTNVYSSEDCKNCRNMFKALSDNVDADDSYVKNVFTSVCNETENYRKCEMFLDFFEPSLKAMFKSHLTSEKMCPELVSSCPSEKFVSDSKDFLEGSCSFCKKTFQSLRSGFGADESRAKLGESFLKLCDNVPGIAQPRCHEFISVFVNKTLPKVASEYSEDETCNYLKLCRAPEPTTNAPEETAVDVKDTETEVKNNACEICMLVMQTVIDQLKSKESEDDIRKTLNSVCSIVPRKFQPKCHKIVTDYADQVVEMILDNLSPAEICAQLNFCDKAQQNLLEIPLLPDLPLPVSAPTTNHSSCRICLIVMRMLINKLQDDKTEDSIRKAIANVCKYFPEETRDTCKRLIAEYTEDMIDMIIADFNETEICTYLKVCGPRLMSPIFWFKNTIPDLKTFDIATNEVREVNNRDETCERCRKLENYLEVRSDKNKTAEEMYQFLMDTCVIEGTEEYIQCAEVISKHLLPYGKSALLGMEEICFKFEVCLRESPEEKDRERSLTALHTAVQECAMCEALVGVISTHKRMLKKDYDFTGNASRICSIVPKGNKRQCMSMLISYGPSIVNLLVDQHVEPNGVCHRLTLCDDTMQAKVKMPVSAPEDDKNDCHKGPSFWCASEENSKKCGTYLHCREVVWVNGKPPQ